MQEVDINNLVNKSKSLNKNIPNNIIIVGKIDNLWIGYKYNKLDLSRLECNKIVYNDQVGESIKNHILPNSLKKLFCFDNEITFLPEILPNSLEELECTFNNLLSLPDLPNSLEKLDCGSNKLTSLPKLPNSLKILNCFSNKLTYFNNVQLPNSLQELCCSYNNLTSFNNVQLPDSLQNLDCSCNQLTSIPDLPNSLQKLNCSSNQLTLIPNLPNSLEELFCYNNKLTSFPNLNMLKSFNGDNEIDYIDYSPDYEETKINFRLYYEGYKRCYSYIVIKDYGKISSKEEYIQYMEKIKLSKIKSARK